MVENAYGMAIWVKNRDFEDGRPEKNVKKCQKWL